MITRKNQPLTVSPVNFADPKRLKRQEWLRRVEATMVDELDGAAVWDGALFWKKTVFTISDMRARIGELKDKQTRKRLTIHEERDLLVLERGLWQVQSRRRSRMITKRQRP